MSNPETSQTDATIRNFQIEHSQREYEQRRNHEYSLVLEYYRLGRQRIERIIYFSGAIPLATIAISDFQNFPKLVFVLGLTFSFFAYIFWFLNEFYGGHWRIDDARQRADLWFQFATAEDQARLKTEREESQSEYDPDAEAERTAIIIASLVIASFLSSLFAFLDQIVDIRWLPTPNLGVFAVGVGSACFALIVLWAIEFRKFLTIGEPS